MKLNLRDLFWLMALIAMGFGWLVDRSALYYGHVYAVEEWSEAITLNAKFENAAKNAGLEFESTANGYKLVPKTSP